MDCCCCFCGELWHTDTVLHDDPGEFVVRGGTVHACPSCATVTDGKFYRKPSAVRHPRSEELLEIAALSENVCDFASDLENFVAAALLDPGEWTPDEREAYRTATQGE